MIYTIILFAIVPFVGHYNNGMLFCNAPCVASSNGIDIYTSSEPIQTLIDLPPNTIVRLA